MLESSRVEEIFLAALEVANARERADYLEKVCDGNTELRVEVERLLKAHPHARQFLEKPGFPSEDATLNYHAGPEESGTVIAGRYKLLEQIGEGGMGAVWLAEQMQPVRRKVALKLIKLGMDSKLVTSRFQAERQALALMDHPNIARVLDGGTTESGRPFFVMEYVKGVPFTDYCDASRLLVTQRLELFIQVCRAVQHAHQKGIVHRDLKPSNVLVCLYDGRPVPKVIDFGLAKALHQPLTDNTLYTAHGVVLGTPLYMSPEQAEQNNLDVDTRTDVYSLGVILYELLTGTTPVDKTRFKDAAWQEMLRLIKEEEPPRPSTRLTTSGTLASIAAQRNTEPLKLAKLMRGDLDWVVMKCLEKERSRRYESAAGLARDLERYLTDETVEACPPGAAYRVRKFIRRNRARVAVAAVLGTTLLVLVAVVIGGLWWSEREATARRYDQQLASARHNEIFASTLGQLEAAISAGRVDEAGALIGQLEKHASQQTALDLKDRQEQLQRDEQMLRELNDIFEERWIVSATDAGFDSRMARQRYPEAYHKYGIDVGKSSALETVRQIGASVIAQALASGLTEWFFVEPEFDGLLEVIDLLDPDESRSKLRGAIARDDEQQIEEITKSINGSSLSPAFAIGLGVHPATSNRMEILVQSWNAHLDSFPLALTLSRLTYRFRFQEADKFDGLAWSRTALVLRPNNPLAHYCYGLALEACGESLFSAAAAEFRRAIDLAPNFAKAYGRLAFILDQDGKSDSSEATDFARRAIDLDDRNLLGHLVLFSNLLQSEDYPEAADMFRRLQNLRDHRDQLQSGHMADGAALAYVDGVIMGSYPALLERLIEREHPQDAWRLIRDFPRIGGFFVSSDVDGETSIKVLAARSAALIGTGQGPERADDDEHSTMRRHAFDELSAALANMRTLIADPLDENRRTVRLELERWIASKDLERVREDAWLMRLPRDEGVQWRSLWKEIQALYDASAIGTAAE